MSERTDKELEQFPQDPRGVFEWGQIMGVLGRGYDPAAVTSDKEHLLRCRATLDDLIKAKESNLRQYRSIFRGDRELPSSAVHIIRRYEAELTDLRRRLVQVESIINNS